MNAYTATTACLSRSSLSHLNQSFTPFLHYLPTTEHHLARNHIASMLHYYTRPIKDEPNPSRCSDIPNKLFHRTYSPLDPGIATWTKGSVQAKELTLNSHDK
ncbi:unnamed protein product [Sphenostylis stenocarpa]|uniref:Uncharacterized protein n=1 Tax=Sphenostylis stenocarpa TaxID=92480 RepID=A0AA86S732_9FABA|nr:unnamed protein product [Sphenostylis stenocarpa]